MIYKRLHHVGIILPKEDYVEEIMDMYGLEKESEGLTPYDTKFIFTKMNPEESDSPIEFLIPYSGVLAEYNGGKGGIAHICFEVDDIEATCAEFREKGYALLEDTCKMVEGTNMKINFVKPRSNHGLLIELIELVK